MYASTTLLADDPERRLAVGQVLATDPAAAGPLTVAGTRSQHGKWYARFVEVADRTAAEALQGTELVVDADHDDDEEDAWYPHELTGLRAEHVDGRVLGTINLTWRRQVLSTTGLVQRHLSDLREAVQTVEERARAAGLGTGA